MPRKIKSVDELNQRYSQWAVLTEERRHICQEVIGEMIENWEGITTTGILIQGTSCVTLPVKLGLKISPKDLMKIFPKLAIESKLD